jgi:hypothetical protein
LLLGAETLGDEFIVIDDIEYAVIPVLGTNVLSFANPVFCAANRTLETKNVIHRDSLLVCSVKITA